MRQAMQSGHYNHPRTTSRKFILDYQQSVCKANACNEQKNRDTPN